MYDNINPITAIIIVNFSTVNKMLSVARMMNFSSVDAVKIITSINVSEVAITETA